MMLQGAGHVGCIFCGEAQAMPGFVLVRVDSNEQGDPFGLVIFLRRNRNSSFVDAESFCALAGLLDCRLALAENGKTTEQEKPARQ